MFRPLFLCFVLIFCSTVSASTKCPFDRPVVLQTGNWDSVGVQNAIHDVLWRVGFQCDTSSVSMANSNDLSMLSSSAVDYFIEVWADLEKLSWQQALDEKKVVNLGTNFIATKGWYVPNYMVNKNAELAYFDKISSQLLTYENGNEPFPLFAGSKYWSGTKIDDEIINKLKLADQLKVVYAESEQEQERQVMHAMLFHKPFILSSWEPSALTRVFNLKRLSASSSSMLHHLYSKSMPVYIVTSTQFFEQYPDVSNIIGKLSINSDIISDLVAKKFEYGWSYKQTAEHFYTHYQDYWMTWGLFPDIATRIKKHYGL